jgi:hypothetical protein
MMKSEIAELEMKIKLIRDGITNLKDIVKSSGSDYQAMIVANQTLRQLTVQLNGLEANLKAKGLS